MSNAIKLEITQSVAKEYFSYNPETGKVIRIKSKMKSSIGRELKPRRDGYFQVAIAGSYIMVARLVFLIMTGSFPKVDVDHINGDKADNRWSNLREATKSENLQNQRQARSDNSTGYLGVSLEKKTGKFRSYITIEGNHAYLGTFTKAEDAHAAYLRAKACVHPFSML